MRTAKITLVLIFCVFAGLKVKPDEAARAADKPLLTIRTFALDPGRTSRNELELEPRRDATTTNERRRK